MVNLKRKLDDLRFFMYHQHTAKSKLQANFELATLPHTSAAAAQHSFRVYHQVQKWLGNDLDSCQWGWSLVGNSVQPTPTTLSPAPEKQLLLISCKCKTCNVSCECKRAGLLCSAMCGKCEGLSCEICQKWTLTNTTSSNFMSNQNKVHLIVARSCQKLFKLHVFIQVKCNLYDLSEYFFWIRRL